MVKRLSLILFIALAASCCITSILISIFEDSSTIERPIVEASYAYAVSIAIILVQAILATSSYFNLYRAVRSNALYSALSFFMLPVLFLLYYFIEVLDREDITFFLLLVELPFYTLLLLGFFWFRKAVRGKLAASPTSS